MPQNGINYAGVMALASAMRHNPELRVLNFNDNTFTKKGTLAMAQVRPCLHIPYKTAHILPVCFCFLYTVFSCRPRRLWDTWGMCRWSTLATAWCAVKEPSPSRQSSERDCQSSRSVGHQISAFFYVCLLRLQPGYGALSCFLFSGAQSVIWWDHRGSSTSGSSSCHGQTWHGESGSEWYAHCWTSIAIPAGVAFMWRGGF